MRAFDPSAGARRRCSTPWWTPPASIGAKKPILEDQERNPLTYTDLIRAAFALGRKIAGHDPAAASASACCCRPAPAAVVTFFALHAFGRVPTMLNFTAGIRNLRAACELAGVKRVLTSHRFVEQGKLHDLIDALEAHCDDHLSGGRAPTDRRARPGCARSAPALFARQFRGAKPAPDDPA